jgi:Na+-transporting NADH:ubiquinone oxidoreductase subunit C
MDKQGNSYTFMYAAVMVIFVAALLAFVAQVLKPTQDKNTEIAKKIDILRSVNIESNAKDAEAKYERFIGNKAYVININGDVKTDVVAFNVDLARELKKPAAERLYPVYECTLESGEVKYILPVRGKGLWGPLWGYISFNNDKNTIYGATFGHKGETPGLGAEIDKPEFQAPFKGKTIFDEDGRFVSIMVRKAGTSKGTSHEVDAISGGTITCNGLEAMLKDCLSGYEKFLKINTSQQ